MLSLNKGIDVYTYHWLGCVKWEMAPGIDDAKTWCNSGNGIMPTFSWFIACMDLAYSYLWFIAFVFLLFQIKKRI